MVLKATILPKKEYDAFKAELEEKIKSIKSLKIEDFQYPETIRRRNKKFTTKTGAWDENSKAIKILLDELSFNASDKTDYDLSDYRKDRKKISDLSDDWASSTGDKNLSGELKKELLESIKEFNAIMEEIIPIEIETFIELTKEEIGSLKIGELTTGSKNRKEKVKGFDDEEVDSKATGKRLYPTVYNIETGEIEKEPYKEIMKILSKIKGSQDIVRYLEESSSSMLDETNPVNQGDKKTPRKMALAKLNMLFDRLEEDALSELEGKEIKKLKVLLDEPYKGTKIGSLKEYTKKYMKDVGDLEVKTRTLSNAKTLLSRLERYESQLVAKNRETDVFGLLGRTKKERRQTLKYLRELYEDPNQVKKYDIKGSGDTFEYQEGPKAPKDTSLMTEETQAQISNEYTRDYFGYEELMGYAESINALLIKRRDSIMTIQQKEELDRLEQKTENLAETIEDQVQIGYGVNPQIEEDLEILEQSQEQIADDTSLLDLIRRSTPLMTTIINDSRTKGGMVMLTQEEENKILKNMKNLANIVESYFEQDFDNQRSEEK